ncbi:Sodium-dependent neutral amino acid transporter B(0)AT2 [Frankliniella fusca]|uniref:Sodium-dependent neutral amino acid transporter B(0)AT2 n=1 Tax=Frankliniella fusca TaxID=407009 RepID=A0AAE1IWL6_9NEOP|nr:Sodium-dependent neutral amino acid transporter B(0)AT2 [Frankliniella fusca]
MTLGPACKKRELCAELARLVRDAISIQDTGDAVLGAGQDKADTLIKESSETRPAPATPGLVLP